MNSAKKLNHRLKLINYFIALSFSLLSFSVQAKLTATVDRTQISENDTLNYSLTLDQQPSGNEPDFSALNKDFSILSKSQSSSLKIINGRSSAYTSWRLELSPLRMGALTIPAIAFQGQISQPITIQINSAIQVSSANQTTANHTSDPLYLTLSASKTSAYIGEQIILTLRIYHQIDILDGSISDLTANNATIQSLDRKKVYTTRVNGVAYQVIEQKYALFAQSSGTQTVSPIQLDATIAQPSIQSTDVFAPFNAANQKQIRIRSNKLMLSIKPKPVGYPISAPWLPTSELHIASSWNPNATPLKVGDPITQTLTVTAKGVQGNSLPDVKITAPNGLKNYPDQPQIKDTTADDGITGGKTQSTAWVALHSGTVKIPDQRIYWWNTKKDHLEITDIPGQTLQVTAIPGSVSTTPINNIPTATQTTPTKTKSASSALQSLMKSPITANTINQSVDLWKIIASILAIIIFLLIGGLFYLLKQLDQLKNSTQTKPQDNAATPSTASLKECATAVLKACNGNDAQATKQAINAWINAYAEQHSVSVETAHEQLEPTEFYFRLNELNDSLYGKSHGEDNNSWSGKLLKHAFLLLAKELGKELLSEKTNQSVKSTHLAELYPK